MSTDRNLSDCDKKKDLSRRLDGWGKSKERDPKVREQIDKEFASLGIRWDLKGGFE